MYDSLRFLRRIFRISVCWCLFLGVSLSVLLLPATGNSQTGREPLAIRAIHIDLLGVTPDDVKRLIDEAAGQRFNILVLDLMWGASIQFKTPTWDVRTNPWKREELVDVIGYARKHGLDVVPQMPLLSHQSAILGKNHTELMFNSSTYNPEKPEVYRYVFSIMDEIIELVHPKAFHIGHDEVVGWERDHFGKFIAEGQNALPAELFLKDVLLLHEHLKKKGIETWMWGDMLIAPNEFPTMMPRVLHGNMPGYGRAMRVRLPRDIVICDWHYSDGQPDFPSLDVMQKEGFRVIGATWDSPATTRNFSRYARQHGAYGMMATTWFHVGKHEWAIVDEIIRVSGKAFQGIE